MRIPFLWTPLASDTPSSLPGYSRPRGRPSSEKCVGLEGHKITIPCKHKHYHLFVIFFCVFKGKITSMSRDDGVPKDTCMYKVVFRLWFSVGFKGKGPQATSFTFIPAVPAYCTDVVGAVRPALPWDAQSGENVEKGTLEGWGQKTKNGYLIKETDHYAVIAGIKLQRARKVNLFFKKRTKGDKKLSTRLTIIQFCKRN